MLAPMEPGSRGQPSLRQRPQSRSCRSSRSPPYDTRNLKKAFRVVFDWAAARDLLSHTRGIYGAPLDDPDTTPEANLVTDGFLPVV
jgi:hypothetical protein